MNKSTQTASLSESTRIIAISGIVSALYIAVTMLIVPIAFSNIQFRVSEIFNHLVVFNKKFFFAIVVGVFLANLFFSPMPAYDIVFGVFHTVISLAITIVVGRYVKNIWSRLFINSFVFSFMIFIIAFELELANNFNFPVPFLLNWLIMAIGEFGVMAIGAPIMYAINKKANFEKYI